jgi:adenosylcobinamide-GDP ribazoletransferase
VNTFLSPFRALNGAFSLLTTLPTLHFYPDEPGRAYAFFPFVGVFIGVVLWGGQIVLRVMLPIDIAAFIGVVLWVLITGGLHLVGFGYSCDGLFAAVGANKRLEIMKDPRTGTWAVLGLILLLLGKWSALRFAPLYTLPMITAVARWVLVIATVSFPYARPTGMGAYFRDGVKRMQIIIATVMIVAVVAFYADFAISIALALFFVIVVAAWAARRLGGGLTGDVYGALCELTEILLLIGVTIQN